MLASYELADAIAKLGQIQSRLVAISDRTDDQRRLDLVNLRRELALQIGMVSGAAEKGFLMTASAEDVREFRSLLSGMRRAVALHQANFPAVRLDEQGAGYDVSVKSVRDANSKFMQWTKENIRSR